MGLPGENELTTADYFGAPAQRSETASVRADSWQLYRVHLFVPRIFTIKPPLESALHLSPETWRASFT